MTLFCFFARIAGFIDAILRNVDVAGHVLTFVAAGREAFLLYSEVVYKLAVFADMASCKHLKCEAAEIAIPKRHCGFKASRLQAFERSEKQKKCQEVLDV